MAAPKEIAMANLKKAHESPNFRGKRGPNRRTLDKQEARRIYLERMSENWEALTNVHFQEALKPENVVERKEAIHQGIGKPVETIEATVTNTLKIDV